MIKILVVALTTLSFSALGFAQAKPATPATPATPAAPATKTEMKSEKAKTIRVTGEVTSLDAKAGTFAVKEKDKEIKLTADSKSAKDTLAKMIASSVKAEPKKATEKKADVTEKKPATK